MTETIPEIPFYAQKSEFIKELSASSPEDRADNLLELGEVLAANEVLSNKQRSNLIQALNRADLLTYKRDFIESDVTPELVDLARWDIEGDGRLQALGTASTFRVCELNPPWSDVVEVAVDLFNRAYDKSHGMIDVLDDNRQNACLTYFQIADREAHRERVDRAERLRERGYLQVRRESLSGVSYEEFHLIAEHDAILLVRKAESLAYNGHIPLLVFDVVQDILYEGCGMAVRDGREQMQKEEW